MKFIYILFWNENNFVILYCYGKKHHLVLRYLSTREDEDSNLMTR